MPNKTPEQIRVEGVQSIKAKAQELYTCATNLRDVVEHIDTGKLNGVDLKALLPHLKDSEHAAALSSSQVKKYRQQLAGILEDVDALLLTLGVASEAKTT